MPSIPVYCRVWFAPIFIGAWAVVGYLWFLAVNEIYPVDDLDFWFYLCLYSGIGTITGLAGWYFARSVARRRASLFAIAILLMPAYLFVAILALDKNPIVAAVATLSVGFIVLMVVLAARSARNPALRTPQPPVPNPQPPPP
jgi:hypothetical protein